MGLRPVLLVACALAVSSPVFGQGSGAVDPAAQPAAAPEGVALLLDRLEALLQKGDRAGFVSLVDTTADPDQVEQFGADLFVAGALRVVVNERDRAPLENSLPDHGYRVVVEMFTETSGRARIVTALLDVRRPNGSGPDAWRITAAQGLTSVEGLYRLRIDPAALLRRPRPDHYRHRSRHHARRGIRVPGGKRSRHDRDGALRPWADAVCAGARDRARAASHLRRVGHAQRGVRLRLRSPASVRVRQPGQFRQPHAGAAESPRSCGGRRTSSRARARTRTASICAT